MFKEVQYDLVDSKRSNLVYANSYLEEELAGDWQFDTTNSDDAEQPPASKDWSAALGSINTHITEVREKQTVSKVRLRRSGTQVCLNLICADGLKFAKEVLKQPP